MADEDRASATSVAGRLGIKLKHLNFVKEYKNKVISYFYEGYRNGRTPNPDILCNTEIKFGLFLDWVVKKRFDFVATGHYASTKEGRLYKGVDDTKDQSYFLYRLGQKQLLSTMFPLGNMLKTDVRKLAEKAGLPTFNRPDSQGICFVGEVNIKEFLKREIKPQEGNLINTSGEVIGKHDGVWFYTIGQRRGFRVKRYFGTPLYVVSKNVEKNEVVVGPIKDVLRNTFDIENVHWIGSISEFPLECDVRIRHLGKLYEATVDKNIVITTEPIFGVASGQSAVFYRDSEVLGGGIIV